MVGKKRKGEVKEAVRTMKVKLIDRKLVGDDVEIKRKIKEKDTKVIVGKDLGEEEMDKDSVSNSEDEGEMEVVEEEVSVRGKDLAGDESRKEQIEKASRITGTGATDTRNLADTKDIGRKEESLSRSVMIRYKGRWRFIEDIKEGNIGGNVSEYKRYQSTHVGIKSVEATLISSARIGGNNVSNMLKIIKYINQKGYKVVETKDNGFGRIELIFENMIEANRCLDDKEERDKKIVDFNIPRNNVSCKGVVTGWDTQVPLEDFVEALQDFEN